MTKFARNIFSISYCNIPNQEDHGGPFWSASDEVHYYISLYKNRVLLSELAWISISWGMNPEIWQLTPFTISLCMCSYSWENNITVYRSIIIQHHFVRQLRRQNSCLHWHTATTHWEPADHQYFKMTDLHQVEAIWKSWIFGDRRNYLTNLGPLLPASLNTVIAYLQVTTEKISPESFKILIFESSRALLKPKNMAKKREIHIHHKLFKILIFRDLKSSTRIGNMTRRLSSMKVMGVSGLELIFYTWNVLIFTCRHRLTKLAKKFPSFFSLKSTLPFSYSTHLQSFLALPSPPLLPWS